MIYVLKQNKGKLNEFATGKDIPTPDKKPDTDCAGSLPLGKVVFKPQKTVIHNGVERLHMRPFFLVLCVLLFNLHGCRYHPFKLKKPRIIQKRKNYKKKKSLR